MNRIEKTFVVNLDKAVKLSKIEDFFKIKDDPLVIFLSSKYILVPNSNSFRSKVLVVKREDLSIFSDTTDKCKVYCLESEKEYYI